ncbi:MAG: hypothetical protein ACKV0T_04325, partial [Planctomycetales bacterium]
METAESTQQMRESRYLDLLTAMFASVAVISGTIAGKIFQLGPVTLLGSAILFPLTYIIGERAAGMAVLADGCSWRLGDSRLGESRDVAR